jgi:enoyl-[acyl-carrier protein] reductase/trans-2-enoyl-CoA reductase (NAD+)
MAELQIFKKLPLGGVDRRSLVTILSERGASTAKALLDSQRQSIKSGGAAIADDTAVLILGGSNGITRALAVQLVFGEKAAVFGVHYDSAKMQIGVHHTEALMALAKTEGLTAEFFNRDATRDTTIEEIVALLKERYRAVHFINGIAAGATKRYEKHGPTTVCDLDVAFDPVLQVPDFSKADNIRQLGLVEVGVATEAEIERTNKFMGTSSKLWADALGEAGLLAKGESVVAFCDYDYEPDDPVYAMGPLAGAKVLQRETMHQIKAEHGVHTVKLCYPAMCTTALGAIPGGALMYAGTAQLLLSHGRYRDIPQLAFESMAMFDNPPADGTLRLDGDYQSILPEFHAFKDGLTPGDVPACFDKLLAHHAG